MGAWEAAMDNIVVETMRAEPLWTLVGATAVLLLAIGLGMVRRAGARQRRRTRVLQQVFGPDYAYTLGVHRNRSRAEAELTSRLRRHAEVWLRDLDVRERERATAQWDAAVALFVESPEGALHEADVLVSEVMRGRGYPVERFEDRASLISLDHPGVAQ